MLGMKKMKVLLINELISGGGTEIQSKREIDMMSKRNYDYYYMTFDSNYPENLDINRKKINIPVKFNKISKIFHRFLPSIKYKKKTQKYANEKKCVPS